MAVLVLDGGNVEVAADARFVWVCEEVVGDSRRKEREKKKKLPFFAMARSEGAAILECIHPVSHVEKRMRVK
jgi:hypothetical protein